MKLVIDYDFYNAIKNVNEPLNMIKVARNNKEWLYVWMPIWTIMNKCNGYDILLSLYISSLSYTFTTLTATAFYKAIGYDTYGLKSTKQLKTLVSQLKDLNVSTDYDLLLKSQLYHKKNSLKINEDKIPYFLQQKYILVPTYDYNGDIKETSIEQEHIIGSKKYILQLGSPKKEYKKVYVLGY